MAKGRLVAHDEVADEDLARCAIQPRRQGRLEDASIDVSVIVEEAQHRPRIDCLDIDFRRATAGIAHAAGNAARAEASLQRKASDRLRLGLQAEFEA